MPVFSLEADFLRFQATGRQHRGCIIPQVVTHSLVHLKMGVIIARNMLSWLKLLINPYCCIYLVFISFISTMQVKQMSNANSCTIIIIIIIIIIINHLYEGCSQLCTWINHASGVFVVLQLFCSYNFWYVWRLFPWWMVCTFTLLLSEACVQCPCGCFL